MKYRAIGFDYGGVIEGKPSRYFNDMVCRTLSVSPEEYANAYFKHNKDLNDGRLISQDELWIRVLNQLGMSQKRQQLADAINRYKKTNKTLNKELLNLVKTVKSNGYKVGILTNNALDVAARIRLEKTHEHFDSFMVSSEMKLSKPDPSLFKLFASSLEVELSEMIYVDDTEKSLSSAKLCGYTPILYTTYEDLVVRLCTLGIDI